MNLVAPLYLAALAALALPWLLHRFSDAPPDRQPFPSTRFLEPTTPPVSRRRTLRYRALLALRVLALIALCLLFAEPWIPRPASLVDARALHVIAVDTSLSMRAGERFERALGAARERIAAVPEGDPVRVLALGREAIALGDEEAGGGATAIAALDTLSPGFVASDYGQLMQLLDRLAEESPLPLRATLVSDVQQSALPERRNTLYAPRLASFDIVDVAGEEANVALAARARSEDGAQARVDVTLFASGGDAAGDPPFERIVTVAHDGEVLARASVSLASGARESVVFERVTLPERLEPRLDISLETEDALPDDDGVRVAVRLGGARRVALGAFDARVGASARVFASTALEAEGAASVDASTLAAGQLPDDERRLVVFTPLVRDEPLPAELTRFVARGGSALIVDAPARSGGGSGERRDAFVNSASSPSTPDPEAALRGSGVGRVDESHPLSLGEIDWGAVRFFALGDYEPDEEDRVLIETEDRRPVLIERPSESGLALVLNERLDGEDSNLPFQPAFVTLMRQVVDWFDTGRAVPERVVVGEAVALPVNVQVLDPAGDALVALADSASAQTLRPDAPGIYTVIGALGEQTLNVVLDPGESDLTPIGAGELADWVGRHDVSSADAASGYGAAEPTEGREASAAPASAATRTEATPPSGSARERAERLVLWPLLLPLLAVLLLAETLFANRRLDVRREGT